MPRPARIPRELRLLPFRGSVAVAGGPLTSSALRGSAWRRLFPDVYIAADVELDHRLWCEAALIYAGRSAADRVVVSGLSAAYLMGVDLLPLGGAPVTITTPLSARVGARASIPSSHLVVVRSNLDARDVGDGRLPTTTPLRTAFDLARTLPFRQAVAAIDAMANHRLVRLAEVRDYALGGLARRGTRQIYRVLAAGEPLAASPMETILRLTMTDGGLPRPEAQVEIYTVDGVFIGRVDLAYRRQRVGIEYDGDYHRDRATFRRDITRVNTMREAGWEILRVTADDLRQPERLIRQIRALLDRP